MKVPIDPPLRENMGGQLGMKAGDYVAGANSPLKFEINMPGADWRDIAITPENQFYPTFDTFACTNYADNNTVEFQLKHRTGKEFNFSDRASAVLSGTVPGVGNYMTAAPEWSRNNGRILEQDWPDDGGATSIAEYYKTVSLEARAKAIKFDESYEWIETSRTNIKYELQDVPPTIMLKAGSSNHDVVALLVDSNGIWYYDSYPHETMDNHLAITTQIPLASLKIKVKPMNTIYFVHIKGTTEYGLLMVSPVGKLYVGASTEEDLKLRGGVVVPLLPTGKVDFSKARDIDLPQ